jgi:uncharacterized protein (TIGR04255 family)
MNQKFERPPINELIIGIYFKSPLLDIYSHHIGIFWEKIRDKYPTIQQKDPIGNIFIEAPNEMFPMPRFWFASSDESHLVQLQRNALLLNWRRRNTEYPHFDSVKKEFDRLFLSFAEFLRSINPEASLAIDRAEVAYINMIEPNEYWKGFIDTATVLPGICTLDIDHPGSELTGLDYRQNSKIDEQMTMIVGVRTGNKVPDETPLLNFEIRAVGPLGGATKEESDEWFSRAHVATGKAFLAITNKDIRDQYWKPIGDTDGQ